MNTSYLTPPDHCTRFHLINVPNMIRVAPIKVSDNKAMANKGRFEDREYSTTVELLRGLEHSYTLQDVTDVSTSQRTFSVSVTAALSRTGFPNCSCIVFGDHD